MAAVLELFTRPIPERAQPLTSTSTTTSPKHAFRGHQDTVSSFIFLQDNVHIVSSSSDGTMCKWDCEKGRRVGKPWKADRPVTTLALSPDGKTIACGRDDGNVQRWDTNGQMMEGIWTVDYWRSVRALSWSPSGCHLASGFGDGTILIRKADSGEVEVGPINANQGWVWSVAYSPSGDRIASGGDNISIWDSHTGELLVGPIQALRVCSIVWSLDGSKLYSGGDNTRVFDSTSGTELHHFQHDHWLSSIALSPKHNLLAGVGDYGIAQLWDMESYKPLGQPFYLQDSKHLYWVSFSPDGRYLAYSGQSGKFTLRMVKDSAQELPVPQTFSINPSHGTQQEALPKSPSSSFLDTNPLAQSAVKSDDECNDPYSTFFMSLKSSPPLPFHKPSAIRRLRATLSPRVPHHDQTKQTLKGKSRAVNDDKECDGVNHSENVSSGTAERSNDKGKQHEEPIVHKQIFTPDDLSSPAELDNNENRALWKSLLRSRKKDSKDVPAAASRDTSPAVVEVYAKRVPKGHAVLEPKHKKKSSRRVHNAPTVPASGSSQGGPSSQGDTVHTETSSGGQARPSSQPIAAHPGQLRQVTSDDSHSDWSIQSPWQKFLDKLCYPCGH